MIQGDPGFIVGPIATFIGHILEFLFNIIHAVTPHNSLGFAIIALTIVVRFLMLPLAFKQQKSMRSMQKLQPEMEKIKSKYGSSKDPEMQKKVSMEMQKLYRDNKVNPLSGCLPLLVTLPIFIALTYVMNQAYIFVTYIWGVYARMADIIMTGIPNYFEIMRSTVLGMLPRGMEIDLAVREDMMRVLNRFTPENYEMLLSYAPTETYYVLYAALIEKTQIEYFFGISLIETSGFSFPQILIPLLAGLTTYLMTWYTMRAQKARDANAQLQQKIMLIVMPVMIGVMTITVPAGVGLYWITSNIFQMIQQPLINKYYEKIEA